MTGFPLQDSAAPLYVRLKEALSNMMGAGMTVGDRLPSETELMARYGVSRTTVRLALGALANEGLITRKQGQGSFVAQPKRAVPFLGSLTEHPTEQGSSLSMSLVSFDILQPTPRITELLELPRDQRSYKVRQVHLLDGEPICYQVAYLPLQRFAELSRENVEHEPLQTLLQRRFAGYLHAADESVEVLLADPYRAELLEISEGSPLLLVQRVSYDAQARATGLTRSFYAGQAVRLQLATPMHSRNTTGFRIALRTQAMAGLPHD